MMAHTQVVQGNAVCSHSISHLYLNKSCNDDRLRCNRIRIAPFLHEPYSIYPFSNRTLNKINASTNKETTKNEFVNDKHDCLKNFTFPNHPIPIQNEPLNESSKRTVQLFQRRSFLSVIPAILLPFSDSILQFQESDLVNQNSKVNPIELNSFSERMYFNSVANAEKEKKREREAYDEQKLLDQNKRIQTLNNAPSNFPSFIREGFEVKVVTGPEYITSPSGLIYYDIEVGEGEPPQPGQQVIFHYIGYNESARRVDSTYLQGRPARTRVGINGLIPGFEEGISSMRPGGKRRIVIPPELGPPTGPSTFFSSKQYEVFDIELLNISTCVRRQIVFYSDVVCD